MFSWYIYLIWFIAYYDLCSETVLVNTTHLIRTNPLLDDLSLYYSLLALTPFPSQVKSWLVIWSAMVWHLEWLSRCFLVLWFSIVSASAI